MWFAAGGSSYRRPELGLVRVLDAKDGTERLHHTVRNGRISSVALSGNGAVLAFAGCWDPHDFLRGWTDNKRGRGFSALWDVGTRRAISSREDLRFDVTALAFSADGRTLVSGDAGGRITFWDPKRDKRIAALDSGQGPVGALALSTDGRLLASGGADTTILLWDVGEIAKRSKEEPTGSGAGANR
jgi:WD40 repeat protein